MAACIFCRIVAGEIPADKVYEDEEVLAFRDINPRAPVHLLLIPRQHLTSLGEVGSEQAQLLGKIQVLAAELARREGLAASGFRLVTNSGADSGQEVGHLHYHLLGGAPLGRFA